jgi:hypothetical protein
MPTGYAEGKAVGIDYAEGSSYADGQKELRRGASTPRGYAEGSPRRRLRRRQLSLRRGLLAVGVSWNSCSDSNFIVPEFAFLHKP